MIIAIIGIVIFTTSFMFSLPQEIIYIGAGLTTIGAIIAWRQKPGDDFNAFH
jgi:hypothetical protein